jgi:ATP diphosphatase
MGMKKMRKTPLEPSSGIPREQAYGSPIGIPNGILAVHPASDPFARLIGVMARLRDPQGGCPWDLQQTPESLVPHTLEEAYEVAEAVAEGDPAALRAELGDLLFQVVFQAQLAGERGDFDLMAVAETLTAKLVHRHPHVFAPDADAPMDAAAVERQWEVLKAREEGHQHRESLLDGIPLALPALARARKLQRRARQVGFDWADPPPALAKVREEIAEVESAIAARESGERVAEEVGDVLFAMVNWARLLGVDAESALRAANRKFERRFRSMENSVSEGEPGLGDRTLEQLEELWEQAKRLERGG